MGTHLKPPSRSELESSPSDYEFPAYFLKNEWERAGKLHEQVWPPVLPLQPEISCFHLFSVSKFCTLLCLKGSLGTAALICPHLLFSVSLLSHQYCKNQTTQNAKNCNKWFNKDPCAPQRCWWGSLMRKHWRRCYLTQVLKHGSEKGGERERISWYNSDASSNVWDFPTHQAILQHQFYDSTKFWHYLLEDSIESHKLRVQSYKTCRLTPIQMPIASPGWHLSSDPPVIDQKLPPPLSQVPLIF